jgi:hypothetical protein
MLKRYDDQALKESAARATEATLAGDDGGAATWHRIDAGEQPAAALALPRASVDTARSRPHRFMCCLAIA